MPLITGCPATARRSVATTAALLGLAALMTLGATEAVAQTRPALVRDVDSQPRSARWLQILQVQFPTNSFSVTENVVPAVPPGKKLFLQSVNTHTLLTDGQSMQDLRLSIVNPALVARFSIDQDFQGAGPSQRHFTGHLAINMMLEPGESLSLFFFRTDDLGSPAMNFSNVTLVGYFVDAN